MVTSDLNNQTIIVADLIAEFLENKKMDTVFAVIGSANSYIFDSINKRGYTKIVYMHHEQAVVMAAGAYYRASGKVCAAIVTAGGGATNAITGVVTNWADSIPCLIISGQESTKYLKEDINLRMFGTQGVKIVEMVTPVTKYTTTIMEANSVLEELERAYYICLDKRPGPVWLDIPFDIQFQKIKHENIKRFEVVKEKVNQKKSAQEVMELLLKAKRPVVLAGHGIKLANAKSDFLTLINSLEIPAVSSWLGIDILEENNPYYFGRPGLYGQRRANFVVQNCDLLLVLGSRMPITITGYNINNFAPAAKIIMVNIDPIELKKYDRFDVCIESDVGDFVKELNLISRRLENAEEWHKKCKEYATKFPTIEPHHIEDNKHHDNSYVMVDKISSLAEENSIIVFEQGTPLASGHQAFKVKKDQIVFASNGLGEMGNGLPSSIGAWFGGKGKTTLCLMADGSLMMNLQELQTLVGYKIPLKIILFNNDGYLFIKHTQKMLFQGRYTGVNAETGVSLPNFERVCNAMNIDYSNTKRMNLKDFMSMSIDKPFLYECFMNPEQDLSPKVKGIVTSTGIVPPPLEEMSPLLTLSEIEESMMTPLNPISYKIERNK
jgi:acetolactate synthase-1/2/3 large subunit